MIKNSAATDSTDWDIVISADAGKLNVNYKELWRYRDLLSMFVKKDIITVYKQTILGPIWFIVQPIFTSLTYILVFSNIAKIGTDGVPEILFYLMGVTLWSFFSDILNTTSKTFTDNASILGKVYFPRLVLPLAKVVSGLVKFSIQFGLFFIIWLYYLLVKKSIHPNIYLLVTPFLLVVLSAISLGFGVLITSLTTKYRDLVFLITFGISLYMYATPVAYPLSHIPERLKIYMLLNPLTSVFEAFKFAFLGNGYFSIFWLLYSTLFTIVLLVIGIFIFNKVERRFIDTV